LLRASLKPFTAVAIVVFSLVAVLHVLRLVFGWEAVINGMAVPMWASVLAIIIAGGLAVMLWRESRPWKPR
jgi:hypothetical protein